MDLSNIEYSFVMPWGKHKNESIEEVPDEYLLWLMANMDESSVVYEEAEKEYNTRGISSRTIKMTFGKFEGTEIHYLPDEYLIYMFNEFDEKSVFFRLVVEELEERGLEY